MTFREISKTRIAHLRSTNFFGGPEKQILEHASRMRDSGYEVGIISFVERNQSNAFLKKAKAAKIAHNHLHTNHPFNPKVILELARTIKQERIQLLVVHDYKANILGRFATWITKVPLLDVSRGWTSENTKVTIFDNLDRLFVRFADHVVAVSEGQRKKLLSCNVSPDKIDVIYNAIDLERATATIKPITRADYNVPSDSILVISAGRLSPEKNFKTLINAAKETLKKDDKLRFLIFGDGVLRNELEKQAADLGLDEYFQFPGFVENVSTFFEQADMFILPSFTEGLSNVLLESYARKIPAIASAVGGNPEVVLHDHTGFLFEPSDVDSLINGILALSASNSLRSEMGHRGFEYIKTNFSFDKQTKRYKELYAKLIEQPGERQDFYEK